MYTNLSFHNLSEHIKAKHKIEYNIHKTHESTTTTTTTQNNTKTKINKQIYTHTPLFFEIVKIEDLSQVHLFEYLKMFLAFPHKGHAELPGEHPKNIFLDPMHTKLCKKC